ncbi:hypothetical protein [Micromonospora sp. SH-82]|uniref:hypothetical protein n=1 Tax=Micromonospora sp. SH-82 TaxID=3132938 RepID=UPI003EBCB5B4
MLMLNQVDDDRISLILNLMLMRYAVIVGGAILLAVIAIVVLRIWLRRGNRVPDRTREWVHDTIDRRVPDRRGAWTIAHSTWEAVTRDPRRDDTPPGRRRD